MGKLIKQSNVMNLILSLAIVALFSACSDDNNNDVSSAGTNGSISKPIEKNKLSKPGSGESHGEKYYSEMSQPLDKATWTEQGKFKKEFAQDCLVRETSGSSNKESARKRWEKPCECIADYMSEHLTDEEAEEYLKDDNHTRSLQIRFEAAAYQCLQKDESTKAAKIIKY